MQTTFFDPADHSWDPGPPMSFARWYPTLTQLPMGRFVIFGGQADKETFPPAGELMSADGSRIRTLPPSAKRRVGLYPDLHLLADGRIQPIHTFRDAVMSFAPAPDDPDTFFVGLVGGLNLLRKEAGVWRDLGPVAHGPRSALEGRLTARRRAEVVELGETVLVDQRRDGAAARAAHGLGFAAHGHGQSGAGGDRRAAMKACAGH